MIHDQRVHVAVDALDATVDDWARRLAAKPEWALHMTKNQFQAYAVTRTLGDVSTLDGDLLAVTVYRKGAVAVARAITNSNQDPHVTTLQDSAEPYTVPHKLSAGVATYRTR